MMDGLEFLFHPETIERAAAAIYEHDEDLTDRGSKLMGIELSEPRITWLELCENEPHVAEGYRARATAAFLAAVSGVKTTN